MADSIRKQILQAVENALSSTGSPATVKRSLPTGVNLQPAQLPVFVLRPAEEDPNPAAHGAYDRAVKFRVICVVGDSANVGDIDNLTDPLLTWAEQKIGADETFGGLALEAVLTHIDWVFEAGEMEFVGAGQDWVISYTTKRNDPTLPAPA